MGNPGLVPEAALQVFHALLYCMACVLAGAALIGLSVYIVLVGSEMFAQHRTKAQRAKVRQMVQHIPVAEETLELSAAASPILVAPKDPCQEGVRVNVSRRGAQIRITLPGALGSEPTEP